MTTQSTNRIRSLAWEDEAPADSRFPRLRQSAPQPGRALPGMPLKMEEEEPGVEDSASSGGPHSDWRRGGAPRKASFGRRWWRPASTVGRFFLTLAVLLVLGGLAVSGYFLKNFLGGDERFRISSSGNIQATGLTEVSRDEILPIFGEDIGRNIFFVPLAERRQQLEQLPWVEKATVMRLLPDQIRVSVVERQPVAFVRQGQQIGLVDANGVLLTMPPAMMAQRHYSFPVVTGIDARDPLPMRQMRMTLYRRLLSELDSNGQHLSAQISEIDLSDPEDAQVLIPEQGGDILARFGQDHFLERYQRYSAHINEWRQQYTKLAVVDLRYDHQIVLEMATGAQASAGEQTAGNVAEENPPAPQDANQGANAGKLAEKHTPAAKATANSTRSEAKESARVKVPSGKSKQATKIKPAKVGAKPAGKTIVHAKAGTAKDKTAKARMVKAKASTKKRAEAKRAALNIGKRKIAPARQGQ